MQAIQTMNKHFYIKPRKRLHNRPTLCYLFNKLGRHESPFNLAVVVGYDLSMITTVNDFFVHQNSDMFFFKIDSMLHASSGKPLPGGCHRTPLKQGGIPGSLDHELPFAKNPVSFRVTWVLQ